MLVFMVCIGIIDGYIGTQGDVMGSGCRYALPNLTWKSKSAFLAGTLAFVRPLLVLHEFGH